MVLILLWVGVGIIDCVIFEIDFGVNEPKKIRNFRNESSVMVNSMK